MDESLTEATAETIALLTAATSKLANTQSDIIESLGQTAESLDLISQSIKSLEKRIAALENA